MASRPDVKIRPLTREQLELLARGNPRAIKALESLIADVYSVLPDATEGAATAAEDAQITADQAVALAQAAVSLAEEALLQESTIAGLRADLEALQSRVSSLEQGYFA